MKTRVIEDTPEQAPEKPPTAAAGGRTENQWASYGRVMIRASHRLRTPLVRVGYGLLRRRSGTRPVSQDPDGAAKIAIPATVFRKREQRRFPEDLCCRSPIAGLVVAVTASAGQEIRPGEPVLIIEAMKMQNEVRSECGGRLKAIHVSPGEAVKPGQVLFELS